jgi:hypothetical protein
MTPEHQAKITAGIIQAQIGSPGVSDLIDKHIVEYFTRFKSYKDKFTYLEWYHIFLDFADKIPHLSTTPSIRENGIREAELIAKQKEYIEFLDNTIADNAPFLDFHGQHISKSELQKGVKLREEIERLSSPLPLSDKK